MTRALLGLACLVGYVSALGCTAAPGRGATEAAQYAGMSPSGRALHSSAHSRPLVTGQDRKEVLDDAERQIWSMVERVVENSPDRVARRRPSESSKSKKGQKSTAGEARSALLPVDSKLLKQATPAEGRHETLRVIGESGDFCAAVTIASRLAVTALHCVRALCDSQHPLGMSPLHGCQIHYSGSRGEDAEGTVVASSEVDLVALLDLNHPHPKYGSLSCDDPRAQDPVYTVSHPGGEQWKLSYGRLSRDPILLDWVQGGSTRVLVAEIPTKRGSSGGGLFDVRDNVVGIQIARFSPWTTDFGKAAFVQANRVFKMAGQYCMKMGASACVGLRCVSSNYDIWSFNR